MSSLNNKLARIRSMLDIAMINNIDVFCTNSHKWIHDRPISKSKLVEIEGYFGVSLPREYRDFILYITDGGAGPSHGLTKLETSVEYKICKKQKEILRLPFPYTETYYEHDDIVVTGAQEKESLGEITADECYRIIDYCYAGTIDICEIGCGYSFKLVVTGATRGFVWEDLSAVDQGMIPTGKKFLDWYEDWLNGVLIEKLDSSSINHT